MTVAVTSEGRRAPEQASHELSLGEVSDVLLSLDGTLARAKKAKKQMAKDPAAHDAVLALDDLICEQERARKRLVHDTYYADAGAFTDLKALPGSGPRRPAGDQRARHGERTADRVSDSPDGRSSYRFDRIVSIAPLAVLPCAQVPARALPAARKRSQDRRQRGFHRQT